MEQVNQPEKRAPAQPPLSSKFQSLLKRPGGSRKNSLTPKQERCVLYQRVSRYLMETVIHNPLFIVLTTSLILANTVTLALDRYPIDQEETEQLEVANQVFTLLFAIEMVILLLGYGLKEYLRDALNIFDGTIVIISLVETILNASNNSFSGGG